MRSDKATDRESSKRGLIIQIFLLSLLLLVTPYVSWRYLSKGLEYRKENLRWLSEFGRFPSVAWVTLDGDTIHSDRWKDHLGLVTISVDPKRATEIEKALVRVREQFQDRPDVGIYHFYSTALSDTQKGVLPKDMIPLDSANYAALQTFAGGLAEFGDAAQPVMLVDRGNLVRKVFDVSQTQDLQYLARVVAILLPPQKVEKPVLQRELEK